MIKTNRTFTEVDTGETFWLYRDPYTGNHDIANNNRTIENGYANRLIAPVEITLNRKQKVRVNPGECYDAKDNRMTNIKIL